MPQERDYPLFLTPSGAPANSHLPTQAAVDKWHAAGLKYPQPEPGESQYFYVQRLARELKAAKAQNPDMFKSRLAPQPTKSKVTSKPQSAPKTKSAGFTVPHKEAARTGRYNVKSLATGSMAMLLGMKPLADRGRGR